MAKKFFYVCAGLFLLALSWHMGARSARAQVGALVQGACIIGNDASGVADRYFYSWFIPGGAAGRRRNNVPIPGFEAIVASYPGGDGVVMLANGDLYYANGTEWTLRGNLLEPGPTPARTESWGGLKSRYR